MDGWILHNYSWCGITAFEYTIDFTCVIFFLGTLYFYSTTFERELCTVQLKRLTENLLATILIIKLFLFCKNISRIQLHKTMLFLRTAINKVLMAK